LLFEESVEFHGFRNYKEFLALHKNWVEPLFSLLEKKGFKKDDVFITSADDEGRKSPEGVEENSGYFITPAGKMFAFWFGWDKGKKQYSIGDDSFYFFGKKKIYRFREIPMFSKEFFEGLEYIEKFFDELKLFLDKTAFEKIKNASKKIAPELLKYFKG